jgi:hypothetical protein
MSNRVERMWKKAGVFQLEAVSQLLSEEIKENLTQNSYISGQALSLKPPEH